MALFQIIIVAIITMAIIHLFEGWKIILILSILLLLDTYIYDIVRAIRKQD